MSPELRQYLIGKASKNLRFFLIKKQNIDLSHNLRYNHPRRGSTMAAIERVQMGKPIINPMILKELNEFNVNELPGLKISIRTSTSSLSDYHEWSLDEINRTRRPIITDGSCS
jgi:hypothetical protein